LGTIEGAATTYGRLRVGIAVPAGALVSHGEEGGERGGEELGNERKGESKRNDGQEMKKRKRRSWVGRRRRRRRRRIRRQNRDG
jgi:hypothetical protein